MMNWIGLKIEKFHDSQTINLVVWVIGMLTIWFVFFLCSPFLSLWDFVRGQGFPPKDELAEFFLFPFTRIWKDLREKKLERRRKKIESFE